MLEKYYTTLAQKAVNSGQGPSLENLHNKVSRCKGVFHLNLGGKAFVILSSFEVEQTMKQN